MKPILFNIIIPIFIAFIIFCITPFFAKLRNKMINFFGRINKSFSSSIYKKASYSNLTGPLSALIHIILLIVVMLFSILYTYLYVSSKIDPEKIVNEKIYKLMKEKDAIKDFEAFNDRLGELLTEQFEKEEKYNLIFVGIFLLSLYIYFYVKISKAETINYLIINFNRNLNIIRPYISEKELFEIKRSWALMGNKDDWKKVNDLIELKMQKINNNA